MYVQGDINLAKTNQVRKRVKSVLESIQGSPGTVTGSPVSRALIGSNPAYLGCVHAISPNLSNLQIGLRFVNHIV